MNRNRLRHSPQQQVLAITRNAIGPRIPETAYRETKALLVQLLVEVVSMESENGTKRSEYEREDS